jgi:hypothetical protein
MESKQRVSKNNAMPCETSLRVTGSATVQQCRDMIVFGVLVQIWCHAQPQAKQEAAKVQMM